MLFACPWHRSMLGVLLLLPPFRWSFWLVRNSESVRESVLLWEQQDKGLPQRAISRLQQQGHSYEYIFRDFFGYFDFWCQLKLMNWCSSTPATNYRRYLSIKRFKTQLKQEFHHTQKPLKSIFAPLKVLVRPKLRIFREKLTSSLFFKRKRVDIAIYWWIICLLVNAQHTTSDGKCDKIVN